MQISGCSISCGVHQAAGLEHYRNDPLHLLLLELGRNTAPNTGMIVFSDADNYGNGKRLAAAIRKAFGRKGLASAKTINPNSGNRITTWVWAPNWKIVSEWMDTQTRGEKAERVFTKANVKKIAFSYRAKPDYADEYNEGGDCMCDDCVREREENEW